MESYLGEFSLCWNTKGEVMSDLTKKIKSALSLRHCSKSQWVYFHECPVGTGYKGSNWIDGYALAAWPSDGNKRISYEIKISRADFLNEIKKAWKRRPAMFFSNEFYFVTPKGLLKKEEIPLECGLIEFEEKSAELNDKLVTVLQAPHRESVRPNWNFVAALLRRQNDLNHKLQIEIDSLKRLGSPTETQRESESRHYSTAKQEEDDIYPIMPPEEIK